MIKNFLILGTLSAIVSACTVGDDGLGSSSQAVVLDQRCAADADCPSGFECETEIEHGPEASYCVSDDSQGTSNGQCPAGYELESEHGETFCKPHGGHGGSSSSSGSRAGSGSSPEGGACSTSADCASGLECEIEVESGVTTSVCKARGG
jgi:Cys-rich repeat protein